MSVSLSENQENEKWASLTALFEPKSISVIGASDDPSRIGGKPLRFINDAGFSGQVYPVNPNRTTVQGLPAYRTVCSIGGDVDLAIIALPTELVVEQVLACEEKGVKAIVIFSSGFAEADDAGAILQEEIQQIARRSGMRILGPNCAGVFNAKIGFFGTFVSAFESGTALPGPLSIASQSGACGGHLTYLCKQRGLGVHYWVTTGNEVDVDVSESMLWLAQSENVKVIATYAEGIRHGDTFIQALEAARRNRKPVIMLKVGRSSIGARAAASHTGALAGEDAVYDAVFRQYGVFRAESIEQMLDVAMICAHGIYPSSRRLGIVTGSGGIGIQMSDAAEACGLEVPLLPSQAQARIKAMLPFAGVANPIDVTAQAINDWTLLERCLDIALTDGDYGATICFLGSAPTASGAADTLLKSLTALRERFPERLIVLSFAAPQNVVQRFEQAGFPVIEDVDRAVRAVAAMASFGTTFEALDDDLRLDQSTRYGQGTDFSASPMSTESLAAIDEYAAKKLLAEAGVPVLPEHIAQDAEGVRLAASEMGCPVALKIVSPDITHKTEVGGVILNLPSPEVAASEARLLLERVAKLRPDSRLSGVLVSPMCEGGVETICGVFCDPVFGPVVMFGLGGVYVEVMQDVAFRLAPFDEGEALSMVKEIRGYQILEGTRGAPPADIEALARALSCLSHFAVVNRETIKEIDINPLVVMPCGQGVIALDALIIPHQVDAAAAADH